MQKINPQISPISADSETRDRDTYKISGAAMKVHAELGCGFLEAVYQAALNVEFEKQSVSFKEQVSLPVYYSGKLLPVFYRADFICYDNIIIELKALDKLTGKEEAQIINYLKATRIQKGLLINFGAASLQYKRFILSK